MAKIDASGSDDIISLLQGLGEETQNVCAMALYKGMQVTADALREAIEDLPTEPFHPLPGAVNGADPLNVLTEDDKEDMLNGITIARFEHTGFGVNSAASIEGYSRHKTKRFPSGIPLPMIARSIESGSSARRKHPFIRPMMRSREEQIVEAMEDAVHTAVDVYAATGSLPAIDSAGGDSTGRGIRKVKG